MLKVNNLDVFYGRAQALRNVSVELGAGELVALIGVNGAGKSTLIMTISGILKPASGTIEFRGKRIDKLPPHRIVSLGLSCVPQDRLLFPEMTVLENLELGAHRASDIRNKDIDQKLREVCVAFPVLNERKKQKAGTLSGGEQQMLAIGRALMASPKLLLLDEPSSGLAPLVVKELTKVIRGLQKEGLTILLVEQNAYLALELSNRCYVLENGTIITSGKSSDLAQSQLIKTAYLGL